MSREKKAARRLKICFFILSAMAFKKAKKNIFVNVITINTRNRSDGLRERLWNYLFIYISRRLFMIVNFIRLSSNSDRTVIICTTEINCYLDKSSSTLSCELSWCEVSIQCGGISFSHILWRSSFTVQGRRQVGHWKLILFGDVFALSFTFSVEFRFQELVRSRHFKFQVSHRSGLRWLVGMNHIRDSRKRVALLAGN